MTNLKLLFLEDDIEDAELIKKTLQRAGMHFDAWLAATRMDFVSMLQEFEFDAILADNSLHQFNAVDALKLLNERRIHVPFILVTGSISEEFAVDIMKQGAWDYVLKDRLQRLPNAIWSAINKHTLETQHNKYLENIIANESLMREAERLAHFGSWLLDMGTGICHWSDEHYRILGYQPGEISAELNSFLARVHPEDLQMVKQKLDFTNFDLKQEYTCRLLLNTGEIKYIQNEFYVSKNEAGKVLILNGFIRDITASITTETKLKSSQKEIADYKYALDVSSILAITDQKGVIKYVNDNFCHISKYTREELLGQDHKIISSGYHSKEFIRDLWVTIANGKIWKGEIKNRAKDGSNYWVDTTIVPFLDKDSKPYQYMAIRADITERKRSEELLLRSEANLRTIFNNTDTGYALLDTSLQVLSFNHTMARFTRDEMGHPISEGAYAPDFFPPDRRPGVVGALNMTLNGIDINYEVQYMQNDGSEKWYHAFYNPVRDNLGAVIGVIMSFIEITNKKLLELHEKKITNDLIQRNNDLEQFAYIISHNLRAPVANIMGISNAIEDGYLDAADRSELLEGLVSSVKKLDGIINDLNVITQTKHAVTNNEPIRFSQMVKDVKVSLGSFIDPKFVVISTDFNDVDVLFGVKSYLYSVFYNLISNSIKYRRRDVSLAINISSKKIDTNVLLIYRDNGMGIDLKKNGKKVFGLYQRFHTNFAEGKGMGLYMVKTHVESMGGRISIESEVNKGTEFLIEFEHQAIY